jgi:arginyl-tRNA synthetase
VFAALGKLAVAEHWPVNWPARCENISFGYVRGMSTRKGEAVWLEAVLDEARDRAGRFRVQRAEASMRGAASLAAGEADTVSEAVGQAALLYFDVSSRRMTDLSFDWDAVLQFEGNTGPYLQYAHARMCGIFRKAGELGLDMADEPGDLAALGADEEWLLVQKLRAYSVAVRRAAEQREPFEIAHYLYELASVFNAFYNRHVVLDVTEPVRSRARLSLVKATQQVLRSGLQLLGIRALEQM